MRVGQATYMGRTSAFTVDQLVNLIDGSGTATYILTPASRMSNGGSGPIAPAKSESPTIDTLILALVVQAGGTINVDGGVLFSGSYTITGGTGRFIGATGSGVFGGSGLYLTETDGIGAFARRGHGLVAGRFEVGGFPGAEFPQSQFVFCVCEQRQTVEGPASAHAGTCGSIPPLRR